MPVLLAGRGGRRPLPVGIAVTTLREANYRWGPRRGVWPGVAASSELGRHDSPGAVAANPHTWPARTRPRGHGGRQHSDQE